MPYETMHKAKEIEEEMERKINGIGVCEQTVAQYSVLN